MPETTVKPLREALGKFWAPFLGMLEGAIIIELVLGQLLENGQMLNFLDYQKWFKENGEGNAELEEYQLRSHEKSASLLLIK